MNGPPQAKTMRRGSLDLDGLPGVGPGLRKAILARFRTPDRFFAALQAMDLQALCEVEGISQRRAVELVRHVRGDQSDNAFLATPSARRIHQDIMQRLQAHASTRQGRNRLSLLDLLDDPDAAQKRMRFCLRMRDAVAALDRDHVRRLLGRLRPLEEPPAHCDTDTLIVADSPQTLDSLRERGLGGHAMLCTPDEVDPDAGLILLAGDTPMDAGGLEQAVEVDSEGPLCDLVPQAVLEWVRHNRRAIEACRDLAAALGRESQASAALEAADAAAVPHRDESGIRAAVEEARKAADAKVRVGAEGLRMSGSELLAAVGSGRLPAALDAVVQEALQEARVVLREATGLSFQPFLPGAPIRTDEEELERVLHGLRSRGRVEQYEAMRRAAGRITRIQDALRAEVAAWLEYDADFALGSFAAAHGLQDWQVGPHLEIDAGVHLALDTHAQPIHYHIGQDARVALLTGANSGGKSTLLELLAQTVILARLGLPTPGQATVPWLQELHYVTTRQGLDAGAFETFLRAFLPACRGDAARLVLADEVESVTELEAAGRILGHFVDRLAQTQSLGVVVTHMAKHIRRSERVRVDGIEATGLDEQHRLVVDRQPRLGRFARSTPELIVERLARTAGAHAPLYEDLLHALRDGHTADEPPGNA